MALLALGAIGVFGVVQVWRLRRSGLVVLALLYVIIAVPQLVAMRDGRGNWLNVAFSGIMLIVLLAPHAWRICNEHSNQTRSEAVDV